MLGGLGAMRLLRSAEPTEVHEAVQFFGRCGLLAQFELRVRTRDDEKVARFIVRCGTNVATHKRLRVRKIADASARAYANQIGGVGAVGRHPFA